jgi:two-component system CheB/CheR fusion protein
VTLDGEPKQVILQVRPSNDPELGSLHLVMFDEYEVAETAPSAPVGPEATEARVELEATRERLRAVVEQDETSQEEMRAANEELQSVNEELRSTLEELETSKEELQSSNEELQTVNQENRHKVEELGQLTSDLQNLMAATEIATLFLDRELRIMRVTPRTRELFNIRASDHGRPFTELRHRLGDALLEQDALRVLERLTPIEREIQSETGEWYLARINPYRSSSGQIQGVVITLVEITRLKNAELVARNSEENFRALVTTSAQMVWTTAADGNVTEDSPSWRTFTGQSFEQFRGSGWADAIHPDDREATLKRWRSSIAAETPFDAEFRLRKSNDGWRRTHARAVPLRDDAGKLRGWVGMNTDVTEQKAVEHAQHEAEAAWEANRRKDEFLAMLGHELRNPLAPLRNAMAIFEKRLPPDPELRRIRDIADRQVSQLVRLVDELLDIARISSGRMELQIKRVDLRDIVNAAVTNIDHAIKQQRHELIIVPRLQLLEVQGDAVRLVQIVSNLLDNAAKYTPEHGRIRVTLCQEGRQALLSVADNGVGLTPEARTSVFDLFARAAPAGGSPISGLGLGLTLVRRLAELHGGTVEAQSDGVGKGAEFVVRLPLAASAQALAAAPDGEAIESGPVTPRRILLVDDNRDVLFSLKLLLEMEGHTVFKALDGKSALETAVKEAPEVVVLDIGLPEMDGYELARQLRRLEATSKAVLIAATGFGQQQDRDRSASAGIDYHLVKPLELNSLRVILEKIRPPQKAERDPEERKTSE